ncbi:hypothetical protein GSI_13228 [Ganoderma sinense ZZ0214-1]|uniref:F-box domain-containing protein n=1 Tax=Ganoderma sinense ZZ0214-1 TaxID=1077348 RepID=A0A2G8RV16_9APHY|nr:hypothetical protein GSI_13228 [Ganoderma sinense ZZ0214-1]
MSEVERFPSFEAHLGHFTVDLIEPHDWHPQPETHIPAPPPLNDLRQEIQKRLDVLAIKEREIFQETLELKSRWNRSLMVTQLPNEILYRIFVDVSEQTKPPSIDGDEGDEDNKNKSASEFRLAKTGWMKLMLVCRRWRDVARATPALWRTIDVGKTIRWMKLALARSGNATLDVSFPSYFSEKHAYLLKPHCHRLRSLRLRSWSPRALRRILRNMLPTLEALEAHHYLENPTTQGEFDIDLGITPKRLPILHTLHIAHSLVPRDLSFYTRLRKLTLSACSFKGSVEEFVQLLSTIPLLEYLDLDEFLQTLSDSGNVISACPLPSLLSLRLSNHHPVHSARFLSLVVIPQAASLSIQAHIGPVEHAHGSTLRAIVPPAPHLASSLPGLGTVTWARLVVTSDQYAIECPYTQPGHEDPDAFLIQLALTSSTVPELQVEWDDHMPEGVADLFALLQSAPLTHLEVSGSCSIVDAGTWARLFRTFPSLVSLEIGASGSIFTGLHEASLTSPVGGPVICRGLGRIAISDYHEVIERPEWVFDPLISCLRYRAERGTQLGELHLKLHETTDEDIFRYISEFRDVASNVVFATGHYSNSSEDGDESSDDEEGWESKSNY